MPDLGSLNDLMYKYFNRAVTGATDPVNIVGTVPVTLTSTTLAASATVAGALIAKVNSAATTNATLVKSTAARLHGYSLTNTHATLTRYVKLHNQATAPTVGTSAVTMVIAIPALRSVNIALTVPVTFATGMSYSIVAGPLDTDAVAVLANEVTGFILYI